MTLPHRHPFRFVDRVVDDGGWVRLTANSSRSRGRTGWTVAWLVEAIAQASALAFARGGEEGAETDLVLAAIDHAELHETLEPGQTLEISVRIEARFGRLVRVRGEVREGPRAIGAATVVLASG